VSTFERLTQILKANFDIDGASLTPESRLADLSIDSLGVIEIMFAVEDEFKIVVPRTQGENAPALTTVADLVAFVDGMVAVQSSAHSPAQSPAESPSSARSATHVSAGSSAQSFAHASTPAPEAKAAAGAQPAERAPTPEEPAPS